LAAVEFIIERKSIVTYVRNPEDKEGFVFIGDGVEVIHTSDPRMIIKVSLNPGILEGSAE